MSKEGSDRFCFSDPRHCGARYFYTIPHSGLARCLATTICVRNSVSLHQTAMLRHSRFRLVFTRQVCTFSVVATIDIKFGILKYVNC
jgi:hypothetical protein